MNRIIRYGCSSHISKKISQRFWLSTRYITWNPNLKWFAGNPYPIWIHLESFLWGVKNGRVLGKTFGRTIYFCPISWSANVPEEWRSIHANLIESYKCMYYRIDPGDGMQVLHPTAQVFLLSNILIVKIWSDCLILTIELFCQGVTHIFYVCYFCAKSYFYSATWAHVVQFIVCLWKTANACSQACWMKEGCWQKLAIISYYMTWTWTKICPQRQIWFFLTTIALKIVESQACLQLGLKCNFQGRITDLRANLWASVKDKEKRISSQNKWVLQETEQILWERVSESEYWREDYQERAT